MITWIGFFEFILAMIIWYPLVGIGYFYLAPKVYNRFSRFYGGYEYDPVSTKNAALIGTPVFFLMILWTLVMLLAKGLHKLTDMWSKDGD